MSGKSVYEIIVDRLVNKIEEENLLPWQKPFIAPCINWYTKREYKGINRILLAGGEYISPGQIKEYNKKNKTEYWFEAGTKYNLAVYYNRSIRKITGEKREKLKREGIPSAQRLYIYQDKDGEFYQKRFVLKYHRVYNIKDVKNKDGECLPSKLGTSIIEHYTPADEIIEKYTAGSGVWIYEDGGDRCFYRQSDDAVHTPLKKYFEATEPYYRVLFHELIHSTGVEKRLNRDCFKKYSLNDGSRAREELVAEIGSLLLASEAGFRDNNEWAHNSDTYILGWLTWIKNNPTEVIIGMQQAEKATQYILNGGKLNDPYASDEESTEDAPII